MEIEHIKSILDKYGDAKHNDNCLGTLIQSFETEPRDYITIDLDGYSLDIYWGTPEGDLLREFIEQLQVQYAHTILETEKRIKAWKW